MSVRALRKTRMEERTKLKKSSIYYFWGEGARFSDLPNLISPKNPAYQEKGTLNLVKNLSFRTCKPYSWPSYGRIHISNFEQLKYYFEI